MEKSAERRLQSIARHLMISPQISTQNLNPNPCSGAAASVSSQPGDNMRHGVGHSCKALQGAGYNPSNYHTWHGEILLKYWESTGLSTKGILKIYGGTTSVVANICDSRGELAAGVASVEAVEKFVSPDYRQQFRNAIHSAPVLMIDAYLHPQSLEVASKVNSHFPKRR